MTALGRVGCARVGKRDKIREIGVSGFDCDIPWGGYYKFCSALHDWGIHDFVEIEGSKSDRGVIAPVNNAECCKKVLRKSCVGDVIGS